MFKFIIVSDTHGADLSKLYTAINTEITQDKAKNPAVKHVLVMVGDVFSTNKLLSTTSNGDFDIAAMQAVAELFPADQRLFVPGNHDYTYEEEQLIKLVQQCRFQTVVSNATFNKDSKLSTVPEFNLKDGDEAVCFGGLMTPETILNNTNAKKVIAEIKASFEFKKQPDVVISHLGLRDDLRRPDHGHIFGGHTHTEGVHPLNRPNSTTKRYVINGGAFGEALVTASLDAKSKDIQATKTVSTKDFAPHAAITNITKKYEADVEGKLGLPVGTLSTPCCAFDAKSMQPSGLDLHPEEVKDSKGHLRITDTVITRTVTDALANKFGCIALFPAAGIRGNFKAGQALNHAELFEAFSTGNKIVKLNITGKELIEGLAKGILHSHQYWRGRGRILHPSSQLAYEYDIEQKPGDVIRSVTVDGQPVDPDKTYTIATTNWAADYCFPSNKIVSTITSDTTNDAKLTPNAQPATVDPYLIAKIVAPHVREQTLTEAFSQRVKCAQTLQVQEDLLPTLDRAKSEVKVDAYNIEHHRKRYNAATKAVSGTAQSAKDSPLRVGEAAAAVAASAQPIAVKSAETPAATAPPKQPSL